MEKRNSTLSSIWLKSALAELSLSGRQARYVIVRIVRKASKAPIWESNEFQEVARCHQRLPNTGLC